MYFKSTEKENSNLKNDHKIEKCTSVNITNNESDKLNTSSGYLNSSESYDTNSFKSFKYDSDYQNKDSSNKSVLSDAANSISNILNANIPPDNQFEDLPSRIDFDDSIISSITDMRSINYDDDDDDLSLKNIFSNSVLSETSKLNEIKLSPENSMMTDISDLSSIFSSEAYFTCPDSYLEKCRKNRSISNKTSITNNEM